MMERPVTTGTVAARRRTPAESTLSPTPIPAGLVSRGGRRVRPRDLWGVIPLKNVGEVMMVLARRKVASGGALAACGDDDIGDASVALLAGGRSHEARY